MSPESKHKELLRLLYTDELTHIYNRRYLREQIPRYIQRIREKGLTFAFFMSDLDNFKGINDTYGHQVGDQALIHFSKIIVGVLRKRGIPIRYAGDEFVIIVPGMDKQQAAKLGDLIHQQLARMPLKVDGAELRLKCSIGISLFPTDGENWEQLFEKADEALYMAKKKGKGRVIIFPDSGKLLTPEKLDSILSNPYIVGRDDILHYIEQHISPQGDPLEFPILLGGDGTGKTRLIEYAKEVANKKLAFSLVAKGYPFWQSEMYGAVFSALGSLFEQRQNISDEVFKKLDDKYKIILKPYLYPWDSKEITASEEVRTLDRVALFEALTQCFFLLRNLGDGAILLDDAEQIDQPSLQFFDSLFAQKEGGKLLFLSTVNSPDLAKGEENVLALLSSMKEVSAKAVIKRFELGPLKLEDIRQLVAKIFDGKTFPPEVEETLLRNSGGNPLFIVETLSFLLQEGKIDTDGDTWDLSGVSVSDIPPRFDDLLKERLMRMDEEAVNVLKLAAVLGEKINPRQLAEMSGLNVQQVLDILGNAKRALLIEETANPEEFIFAHRLDRSVFYSLMSEEERTHYHKLAAEIEKKYGEGSLERVVGRLAYHYQNAGELEKAAQLFSALQEQMKAVLISEGTRRALQKRIITASMAKESPLEEEDLAKAVEVARAFKVAMQNLRLYPKENENVKKSIERFMGLLNHFLSTKTEALSISLTSETMLFNGQPPPPNKADRRLTEDLYSTLSSFGLQGVLFTRGVTDSEVVSFLEVFSLHPEEVANRWDEIVEERQLTCVLPDRKMFVAVGEHKVVLEEEKLLAITAGKEKTDLETSTQSSAPAVSDERMKELRAIVEQFAKDKEELLNALRSGALGNAEVQRLVNLLEQADVMKMSADSDKEKSGEQAGKADKYAGTLPDVEFIKEAETDIYSAFEDLNSPDTSTRAKAAAWLMQQDADKLSEAAFRAICSDMPLKTRRLAAAVVEKAGKEAAEALLKKVRPVLSSAILKKFLDVALVFSQEPMLISVLSELVLMGPADILHSSLEILKQLPGKSVDAVLVEMFNQAGDRTKIEILPLIVERRIVESVPSMLEIIKPKKMWEKDENPSLQAQICKTLGYLRAADAVNALIAAARVPKPWTFLKPKPDSVRAAAAWALKQMPKNETITKILEELKRDKSPMVRRIVG